MCLMKRAVHGRHGYTLIELILAISLGMVILLTAFSGMRMASQTITLAKRMSLENDVMRAGYFIAVEEADTWRMYDNPDDPGAGQSSSSLGTSSQQCLRCWDANPSWNRGMSFTPFSVSMPASGGGSPSPLGLTPISETQRGWDPCYTWPASDSRTWFHGNIDEMVWSTQHIFGLYGIFCHHKSNPNLSSYNNFGVNFGMASPNHTWQCNMLESLKNGLGYYGVCEYVPANTIYGVNGDPGGDNAFGTGDDIDNHLEPEWCDPQGNGGGIQWRFSDNDGGTQWPRGLYRNTRDATYPIVPASPYTSTQPPMDINDLVCQGFRGWATDRVSDAANTSPGNHGLQDLFSRTQIAIPAFPMVSVAGSNAQIAQKPDYWPNLTVKVMHYVNNCRIVTMCRVDWTSAITGQSSEYNFAITSTSLRGARQMRNPNGGWAQPGFWQYWQNPGDPNLDYP
jgi:hypothetical protein